MFQNILTQSSLYKVLIYAIPLIFAITLHEAAHAYLAHRCGDDTAKIAGRMSLNPIKHIDPLGTIVFPLLSMLVGGVLFGWAKPVPINYIYLRNPKRDMFLVSIAGPLANFAMALVWALLLKFSILLNGSNMALVLSLVSQAGISINISLMILNLLPFLPLDGGRILLSLLPIRLAFRFMRFEPYGLIILLLFLLLGGYNLVIQPLYFYSVNFILSLIQ